MQRFNRLAIALLELRTDPPATLLITFLCGVFGFGIAVNYLTNLLTDFSGSIGGLPGAFVVLIILFAIAYLSYTYYEKRLESNIQISEKSNVPPMGYIITALAPLQTFSTGGDNLENIRRLILHHQPRLQELHIISVLTYKDGKMVVMNPDYGESQGVVTAYENLQIWLKENFTTFPIIQLHGVNDPNSAQDSFNTISILFNKFKDYSLISPNDVIIDVTAGTKAMSVGMSMAAFINNYPISYQATKRNSQGLPDFTANSRDTSMVYLEIDQNIRLKQ